MRNIWNQTETLLRNYSGCQKGTSCAHSLLGERPRKTYYEVKEEEYKSGHYREQRSTPTSAPATLVSAETPTQEDLTSTEASQLSAGAFSTSGSCTKETSSEGTSNLFDPLVCFLQRGTTTTKQSAGSLFALIDLIHSGTERAACT